MIELFIKHKVKITFSIDGDKKISDRNRRLLSGNAGTYDTVYHNLKRLYRADPSFFVQNVNINAVWTFIEPKRELLQYFRNDPILKQIKVTINNVDDRMINRKFYIDPQNENEDLVDRTDDLIAKLGLWKPLYGKIDESILDDIEFIHRQLGNYEEIPDTFHHSGPCMPGTTRLFIDTNGDIRPCEKCSGSSDTMVIGTIKDGFDMDKIKQLINVGELTEEECKNCWAISFCQVCGIFIDNNGFSREMKQNLCCFKRNSILKRLKNYVIYRECGYTN